MNIPSGNERITSATNSRYENKGYRYYVLGALSVAYVFNFVDRQILAILQEPIKAELGLSDAQLGLLTGFAFAVFYVTFGLAIARWADFGVRRNIIALAIGIWSLMTGVCGLAQNYWHLLLARIGVGVGESGGSPPAHSMISDIFAPQERATALGTYSLGVNIGVLAGFLMGGWLNEFFGWRVAFVAVAVPGLVLALVLRLTVEEPLRGRSEGATAEASTEPPPPVGVVIRELLGKRTFRHLAMGSALAALAGYAGLNWLPSYLMRSHEMSSGAIGTWLAIIAGFCGGLGTFLGGYLADRFGKHDVRWYAWVPGMAILLAVPTTAITFSSGNSTLALLCYAIPAGATAMYLGPVISVTHGLVSNRMRALASAIYFLILNIIGMGLGPLAVGVISDLLQPGLGPGEGLRYALLGVVPVAALWSSLHFLAASRVIRSELKVH